MTRLSRRQVLRGAGGVLVGLPALEALAREWLAPTPWRRPNVSSGCTTPTVSSRPSGSPPESPTTTFTLSPIHQPLGPVEGAPAHHQRPRHGRRGLGPRRTARQRGLGAFLTGAKLDTGNFVGNDGSRAGYALGPSVDQTLVGLIGQTTRVPSLQLGVHALVPNVSGVVSYAGSTQPLLPQNDPRLTFRTLFMDSGTPRRSSIVFARAESRTRLGAEPARCAAAKGQHGRQRASR